MKFFNACLVLCVIALPVQVQPAEPGEAVVTLRSQVSGNQELPKVMYIVPWQTSRGAAAQYALEPGIAQELFLPLDREEFQREIKYGEMNFLNTENKGENYGNL